MPEIAELLHLQRSAAGIAASGVVLLALLLTLIAPGVVPANVLTGVLVGVLAVLVAVAVAVVLDGRDPVLRGPRHLRRDGHAVLARMAGPDPIRHGAPVLAALERRLDGRDHVSVVITGTATDPSALAVALGRGAAADGHAALVIDLGAEVAPGVADVRGGTALGEAAQLADDRPYAWIGAGVDGAAAAAEGAAGVARRPPSDLDLLLVVAPEITIDVHEALQACERTVLLVAADTQHRARVTARLETLRRAGGRPEAVVVGGLRVTEPDAGEIEGAIDDDVPVGAGRDEPASEPDAGVPDVVVSGSSQPDTDPVVPPSPEPAPSPQPPPTVPDPQEPEEPEPAPAPEPGPDAPPVVVPDPEDMASDPEDTASDPEDTVLDPEDTVLDLDTEDTVLDLDTEDTAPDEPEETGTDEPQDTAPDEPEETGTDEPQDTAPDEPEEDLPAEPDDSLADTGPMQRVTLHATGSGRTSVEGMADGDPLVATVALEQLLEEQLEQRHRDRA